ncbi:MAG: TrkA family potassium uptake protein [Negativicutes bacterium]|nr:TrkA family potassium uptake protein [Negativicutes bacterium]
MQIIVIGCGKVGSSLAAQLIQQGHDVVILESDSELMHLADNLNCVKLIGIPFDQDIMKQAGAETADVVCAVSQNDNVNIMSAQVAKEVFGVKKIITRVYDPNLKVICEQFGLDTICSTDLTVQALIRDIANETEIVSQKIFNTRIIYTITSIDESLIEEEITNLSSDTGKLIFGILREGKMILAASGVKIAAGDQMILVNIE